MRGVSRPDGVGVMIRGDGDQRFEGIRVVQFSAVRVWCTWVEYDVQTESSAVGDGVRCRVENLQAFFARGKGTVHR